MFGIFDKIEEFFKELLLGGIQANLESMFLDINDKVGAVATDVGKTPMGWNGDVFAFIKSINDSVIIPIAGLIITAVLCIELINMVMQKNNMHDTDTFEFFKYIIKMWIAVWLVSHAFEFSMAVFDVAQHMVNKAAGVINTSATVSGDQIVAMMDTLKEKGLNDAKERNSGQKRIKCTLTERKDRMIKRKTVFTVVVIGAGVIAVIDRIKLFSKINDLEERTKDIGRCHNDFCILQERYNKNTDKQIESIQEEIGSVYEHMAF